MSTYDLVADLPVRIDDYALEGLVQQVSSDFERKTTIIHLRGGEEEGVGEDVVYDAVDHEIAQDAGPILPLAGDWTMRSFSEHLATLDPFPKEPQRDVSRLYRTWAYESAALDLALRQAGEPLHAVLGRAPQPLTFVVSLRLGEPPIARARHAPPRALPVAALQARPDGVVGRGPDRRPRRDRRRSTPSTSRGCTPARPSTSPPTRSCTSASSPPSRRRGSRTPSSSRRSTSCSSAHRDRVTWDANIHSIADIEGLPFAPRMVNLKPSRLGGIKPLFDAYDYTAERGIGAYGGGQFELGPGRGQIQYLASLFHPDTPNDTSPSGFHVVDPPPGLPTSPIEPLPSATGFRWG